MVLDYETDVVIHIRDTLLDEFVLRPSCSDEPEWVTPLVTVLRDIPLGDLPQDTSRGREIIDKPVDSVLILDLYTTGAGGGGERERGAMAAVFGAC